MGVFDDLGQQMESAWQKTGNDLERFPALATGLLENFNYKLSKEQLDQTLAEWFLQGRNLPEQINVHNTFGQPPITIFNNGKFVVDIYIWLTFDTSIHSHGFRGAFRVLHGKSLHETFNAKILEQIAPDVAITELGEPELALLEAGSVRTILPGRELTHRVIHLENPTVTLCVKTINESDLFQWNYFPNGLAIKKRHVPPGLIKEIYYFQYLLGQNEKAGLAFINSLLDQLDISTQMNLCEEITSGACDLTEDVTTQFLDQILERHLLTKWFKLFEAVNSLHLDEISFAQSSSALGRLAAHFINCGVSFTAAQPLLSQLARHEVTRADVKKEVMALLDVEDMAPQIEKLNGFLA